MAYRRGHRPRNKGKKCSRYKRVYVKGQGYARRCARFGRRKSTAGRRKRRRGFKPYNRGRKCVEKGYNKHGKLVCRSYGAVYGGKRKNRRRTRPMSDKTYSNKLRNLARRGYDADETRYGFPLPSAADESSWPMMMAL